MDEGSTRWKQFGNYLTWLPTRRSMQAPQSTDGAFCLLLSLLLQLVPTPPRRLSSPLSIYSTLNLSSALY